MSTRDIVTIYTRRKPPRQEEEDHDDIEQPQQLLCADPTPARKREPTQKKRHTSWIDRSLSSRSNTRAYRFRRAISHKGLRNKRIEAPSSFIQERRAYFEEVDAFELEEETPPPKARWMNPQQHSDMLISGLNFSRKGFLQAVQEDSYGESQLEPIVYRIPSGRDTLSCILKTPQFNQALVLDMALKSSSRSRGGYMSSQQDKSVKSKMNPSDSLRANVLASTQKQLKDAFLQNDGVHSSEECCMDNNEEYSNMEINSPVPQKTMSCSQNSCTPVSNFNVMASAKQTLVHSAAKSCGEDSEMMDSEDLQTLPSKGNRSNKKLVIHADYTSPSLVHEMQKLNVEEDECCLSTTKGHHVYDDEDEIVMEQDSEDKTLEFSVFDALLEKCGQKEPLTLREAILQFSDSKDILKLGEGTYGEAFRGSSTVFKIVPMDGDFLVNGEPQKALAEMYTEMLLTLTLNRFRECNAKFTLQQNMCNSFIETKMVRVCQGSYDVDLIKAWEEWDAKHESENEHPKIFPEKQLYMLFVLADGGKDLEGFPVTSFEIARSIVMQVTAALAVAEEECEFEHRDLHWGNILLAQTKDTKAHYRLNGRDMYIDTYGVFVHIIDFTLSRVNTGTEVLFCDLSADPLLFQGRKGDVQAETYRKMLQETQGQWGNSFLKTNCFWIHYLVEILLTKKLNHNRHQEIRNLRGFKKRVMGYSSARTCLEEDEFFASLKTN